MTSKRSFLPFVIAVSIGTTACRSELLAPRPEPVTEPGPVISLDQASYNWSLSGQVRWAIRNPQALPVYLIWPSDYVRLQRYDGGVWRDLPTWYAWALDQTMVHALAQGDSLVGSVPLTNDVVPTSGWHRLVFLIYKDSAGTVMWPLGNRVTAAVWIGPSGGA